MKVFYDRTKFYGPLSLSRSFLSDGRSTRGPGLGSGTTRSTPLGLRFVEFLSAQGKLYGLSQLLVIRSSLFSKTAGRAGYPSRCENGRYGLWFLIILEIKVHCLRIHCTGSQGFQTNKSMQAVRTDFFWGSRLTLSRTTKCGRGPAIDAAKKNYDDDCEGIPEWKRVLSQAWET